MTNSLFADGVKDIVIQNGVVRIDFFDYSATEKDADGKAVAVFAQRVVMPLPAFAQAFGAMERMVNELMERGVITKKDGKTEALETTAPEGEA